MTKTEDALIEKMNSQYRKSYSYSTGTVVEAGGSKGSIPTKRVHEAMRRLEAKGKVRLVSTFNYRTASRGRVGHATDWCWELV